MVKPLILVAFVADLFMLVLSKDYQQPSSRCSGGSTTTPCTTQQPPFCRINEIWSNCPAAVCAPKTCNDVGFPVACLDLGPDGLCPVPPGCICREGYVRNHGNICVPMTHCPSCGGDSNAVSGCYNCNRLCSNYNKKYPDDCTTSCMYNSCECRLGFVLDEVTGKCVFPSQCTVCSGPNEIYDPCPVTCPPQVCGVNTALILCAVAPKLGDPECQPGCRCIDNYVRNHAGECIPRDQCPSCDGPNEFYACGGACDNVCATLHEQNQTNCPIINVRCNDMCYCEEGYARNDNNICIPIEKCPMQKCKGQHEVYSECIQGDCKPKTCTELGFPIPCPRIDPAYCEKGCLCEDGFVRDKNGICILKEHCPSCGGDCRAVSGCGVHCNNFCSDIGKEPRFCIEICYENACDCKEGNYFDNNTKKCVPPDQCTPTCGADEIYSDCVQENCDPQNCKQLGFPIDCPVVERKHCRGGCLCKPGYVRNSNGFCIPVTECPPVCNKTNEVYSECINGGCSRKNCSQVGLPVPCVKIDPKYCIKGCLCEDGYLKEDNGECVPEKDCKQPQCKKNEIYEKCPAWTCKPKSCCDVGYPMSCPAITEDTKCPVKPACVCIDGYVKNDNGECIPIKECPSCGGDLNAKPGCGTNCGKKCEDLGKDSVMCPLKCSPNACDCKDGYYYDKNKDKCVIPSECTGICSGENEVYEDCENPTCRAKKCSELGFPLNCTYVPECNKGCVCKDGYVRNAKGECIPIKHCPSCGGDDKAQSGCGGNCLKTCYDFQNPDKPKPCLKICRVNSCDCKDGYYYDGNTKKCVHSSKCTPTCGDDEVYDPCTNGGCRIKKCSQIGGPMPSKQPKKCKPGCSCKEGYLRSSKGNCITAKKCPKAKCGKNEKFILCPSGYCGPRRCDQLGYPIECPVIKDGCCPGPPGCICADNYVRDDHGKCIPVRECPPSCPDNEEYDYCVNGGCGRRNCSQINDPMLCIDPIKCKEGCTCKKDYLRDDDTGICVPKDKCPKICDKPNEEFVKCPPKCPPQTCESINKTYHCPKILVKINESDCVGDCRCKDGFYKNLNDECIPKDNCLKCTRDHEYHSCGPACDNVCSNLDTQSKDNCPIKNKKCVPRCYCEDGYARDDDDNCVPIDECPEREPVVNSTVALANFQRGNFKLTMDLLKEYYDTRPDENIMLSALSIMMALGEFTLPAIDETLEQMLDLLYLKNKKEVRVVFHNVIESLKDPEDVTFELKNKYYADEDSCPLTEQFIKDAKEVFFSEAENINFSDNDEAADTINEWVSDSTRGLIKNLVKPEMFSSLTRLAVFNVLYFLGNWQHPFDEKKTKLAKFYLNDEDSVMLPTMNQINTFQYGESDELDSKIIILPYKGQQYKLVIILPNSRTGMKFVLKNLDANVFEKIKESLSYEKCNVSVPLMDFANDYSDLKDSLVKIGLSAPCESNSDDFRGIIKNDEPLTISDIIQKSVFKMNEKGTEAAVASGAILTTRSQPQPSTIYNFKANCPFIFFLESSDTIILSGAFNG